MLAPKKNETPMTYWISFWPTAPMFGVAWRFEGVFPNFFQPVAVIGAVARASAAEAADAVTTGAAEAAAAIEKTMAASADIITGAASIVVDEIEPYAEDAADAGAEALETVTEQIEDVSKAFAEEAAAEAAAIARPATLFAERPAEIDDLKQIKGVGPKLESMLNEMGIYRLDQIAAFSAANLAWVDDSLTTFKGRPLRDDWIAQARALLSGSKQLI